MAIPAAFYHQELIQQIDALIEFHREDALSGFFGFDEIHQEELIATVLRVINFDAEIVLTRSINTLFYDYLRAPRCDNYDQKSDFMAAVTQTYKESFADILDEMIVEALENRAEDIEC